MNSKEGILGLPALQAQNVLLAIHVDHHSCAAEATTLDAGPGRLRRQGEWHGDTAHCCRRTRHCGRPANPPPTHTRRCTRSSTASTLSLRAAPAVAGASAGAKASCAPATTLSSVGGAGHGRQRGREGRSGDLVAPGQRRAPRHASAAACSGDILIEQGSRRQGAEGDGGRHPGRS
eukprot:365228-Chlamydomonas_euryale.AAC.9